MLALAIVHSAALQGVDAVPVTVEVSYRTGEEFKAVTVGLPSASVKESTDRAFSAMRNSQYGLPNQSLTINLAPGHIRKEGPMYDLPLALALLALAAKLPRESLDGWLIAGELSLSGRVLPVRGGLAMAVLARQQGLKGVLLPRRSAQEAALVAGIAVHAVDTLQEAVRFLTGERVQAPLQPEAPPPESGDEAGYTADFGEVKGQHGLRRAVEVAVAGGHNLLIIGPPGSGKSMVAKRIPTIMPELSLEEHLDVLRVHSAAGMTLNDHPLTPRRPFRSPHHTISDVGLIGGGSHPAPGEISLAHHGVLFLDELPEFKRSALEVMRQPLEDGQVCISRSAGKVTFPASFMLVAAMNPTPCGHLPEEGGRSSPVQIERYRARISGPLLDRIDLHVEAPALRIDELRHAKPGESSAAIRARVQAARELQARRFRQPRANVNARMNPEQIRQHCALSPRQGDLLQAAMERLHLSARAYDRILKVARTIADLAGEARIADPHLLEAIQYRSLDRAYFGGR